MAEKKIFTALNLQGNKIANVGAPVNDTDVATKASAQAQATAAQAAAEATATTLATTAKTEAITAAATDATTKANTALSSAKTYTDSEITKLINGAPDLLNTLDELALALGDDANFATNVANSIAAKTGKAVVTITGTGTTGADGVEYNVFHNLGKAAIVAQAFDGNDSVDVFIRKVDNNNLKVITGSALNATELSIVVIG